MPQGRSSLPRPPGPGDEDPGSWALGNAPSGPAYDVGSDGALRADGVAITESGGWLDVALPQGAVHNGAPAAARVRLRGTAQPTGFFLHLEEILAAGVRHAPRALATGAGAAWFPGVIQGVFAALERNTRRDAATRKLRFRPGG